MNWKTSVWTGCILMLVSGVAGTLTHAKPETLEGIIKTQQKKHVRESVGEAAFQCFTDEDLERFNNAGTATKIAEELKHDSDFVAVVLKLKAITREERQEQLRSCLKPLRPTWAQLGRITPEGQTEAGQKAEMLIAKAIVDLVVELLK